MQTSDQPSQEQEKQQEQIPIEKVNGIPSSPLSEFPPGHGPQPTGPQMQAELLSSYDDDAVLKGLIYPPPPSFYQRQPSAPQPALSVSGSAKAVSGPVQKEPESPPSPYHPGTYPPVPASWPPSPPHYSPVFVPYGPPVRRQSYIWLWVLIPLVALLLISGCGIMAFVSYTLFGTSARSLDDAYSNGPLVVNKYYSALQNGDYDLAYQYLHPQGSIADLTADQFHEQALQRDTQAGTVSTFQTGEPALDTQSGAEVTSFAIVVKVTRAGGEQYSVHLTVRKVGAQWKIADFDKI